MLNELHKEGVFKAICERRDIRQFNSKPIPEESLEKILLAGHHAPSVGFMQPWNFILINDEKIKERLAWAADKERRALAIHYEGDRADQFLNLKIEGIKEAPLTICVTCDPTRGGSHVLGRNSIPETDILSVACAIQNMWLACYAEGLAMGWVSFYKKNDVREILNIPPHIEPIALLSIGYTDHYPTAPILETENWEQRRSLHDLVFYDTWGASVQEYTTLLEKTVNKIEPLNEKVMEGAQAHLDQLTKPPGSLGALEKLAKQLAGITGAKQPDFPDKRVVVMAADHGVAEAGISAYPKEVTVQMVHNFLRGGAAINVMAQNAGGKVVCVDVGVDADLAGVNGLIHRKVAFGTANMLKAPAMSKEHVIQAIEVGIQVAFEQIRDGAKLLATGEVGIGNTTASSAVLSSLTGKPAEQVVGCGTGIALSSLARKIEVVEQAIELHQPDPKDPLDVLQKVGGLEIAALAGLIIGAAAKRVPVVLDGFISTVAALCAVRLQPLVREYLIPSHQSEEPGHRIVMEELGLTPVLQMNMRLGEGTGAALMFPIIDTVHAIMTEMATFDSAGVANRVEST